MKAVIFDLDDTLFDTTGQLDETYSGINSIKLFNGVVDLLENTKKDRLLFLVTFGDKEIQQKKVDVLGIEEYFTKIYIVSQIQDKKRCYLSILSEYNLKPRNVFVVGDRMDSEILFGNELCLRTVHVKQGKRRHILPENDKQKPDFQLENIVDLPKQPFFIL